MRRTLAILTALTLVYCADPSGPDAPVAFGIVSGDGQVVTAGRDSLLDPVVGQAYEDEDGNVAFRLGAAPLHAQTAIGTGVPNVLTCAEPIGDTGLVPYIQCATTDADGLVRYWFEPGVIATDSACAEVRAEVDDQPTVVAMT